MTATRFSYEQSEWRPPDSELEPALPWLENEAGLGFWGLRPKECSSVGPVPKRANSSKAPNDETLTQPLNIDAPELQI